ncbi:MAG: RusA family crossover junction endodeoxyribonuclease [Anaerolineales bacterium]|nr:RusA family crossover junction endodeoxyribonuclease [Anaerolineales bacterium]
MSDIQVFDILPVAAPRQSRRDKWAPSKAVQNYRAFRDRVAYQIQELPEDFFHVVFVLPMAESWSRKKKLAQCGQPHELKPDADNLVKALLDAVYRNREDSQVWNYAVTKLWGFTGAIVISDDWLPFYELPVDLGALVRGSWEVYDRTPVV